MFTLDEVTDAISNLDCKKDAGPISISAKFIIYNCDKLAPILLEIFNGILATGIFPSEWKNAYITPIPKKGSLADVANYRWIAMQSIIPKLFDVLITGKIYSHVSAIIPNCQHGFVKGRSTTSNLFEITHFMQQNLRQNDKVDVVYFDFSKAFDHVDHALLAAKLASIATPYTLYKAIITFICYRVYTLKVDGRVCSNVFTSTSGVPQGSHCGPLLYLIMG